MRAVNSFIEYFIASDATLKSKPHRLERLKWSNSATKNKIKEQTNQTGQGCTQVVGLLPTRKHPPYFSQFAVNTHVLCTRQKRGKKKPSSSSYYVPFRWWWSQHGCSLPFYELLCYGWDWDAFSGWYVPWLSPSTVLQPLNQHRQSFRPAPICWTRPPRSVAASLTPVLCVFHWALFIYDLNFKE